MSKKLIRLVPFYLDDTRTKFLGETLQSNSAFNEGNNPFSERNKNLSSRTQVSTNGANISRSEPKTKTLFHWFKNSSTFGRVNSES